MSQWGVHRFVAGRRRTVIVLVVVVVLIAGAWWLLVLQPWSFSRERDTLAVRLDRGTVALIDRRERIEAGLRLQELEIAIANGRRSSELRPGYRLTEERLETVLARETPEKRAELRADITALLSDLTRDRGTASARIRRIIAELRVSGEAKRQGDGE